MERVRFDYPAPSVRRSARQCALLDVDLSVPSASRLGIVGTNGAGKSTLLQLMNGTLRPKSGQIHFAGAAFDYSRKGLFAIRQRVALVFQDPDDQIFAATVRQDVSFGPCNLGLDETEINVRVDEAIRAMGLGEFDELAPHLLSHGEKKRVAIAGALAMRPSLLVLDEPTAGLNPLGIPCLGAQVGRASRQRHCHRHCVPRLAVLAPLGKIRRCAARGTSDCRRRHSSLAGRPALPIIRGAIRRVSA
ncbi:MAG: ABC transporter ATP-binding protein [Polyangiaceae bacterium]